MNTAPEYTKRERITLFITYFSIGLPVLALFKYWFLPRMETFGEAAHCYDFGWFNGVQLMFYGVFVGIPLSLAIMLLVLEGKRLILVYKHKQTPPPGYKVFKPTEYTYGNKALFQPVLFSIVCVSLLVLSMHGIGSAKEITDSPRTITLVTNKASLPECNGL